MGAARIKHNPGRITDLEDRVQEERYEVVNPVRRTRAQVFPIPRPPAVPEIDTIPVKCMQKKERFKIEDFLHGTMVTMTAAQFLDRASTSRQQLARASTASNPAGKKSAIGKTVRKPEGRRRHGSCPERTWISVRRGEERERS